MTLPSPTRALIYLAVLCCGGALLHSAPPPPDPWAQASQFLFNDAHQSFTQTTSAPDRTDRLGAAVVLLNVQPRTAGNLTAARTALEGLVAENASDEAGLNARFFLGRIASLHQTPSDLATARRYFDALIAQNPAHPLAQQAVVKLALLDFYPANGKPPASALYTRYATHADALTDASARRDLHLLLARACLFYQASQPASVASFSPAEYALTHYQAALATGALSFRVRGETLVAIGELAHALGRDAVAAEAWRAFLSAYSRDIRAGTITAHLAALSDPAAPAATP